jgi:hypothetical protein
MASRVEPLALPLTDPLARVDGVMNALIVETDTVREVTIIEPGAGQEQAGQGLFSDLVAVARGLAGAHLPPIEPPLIVPTTRSRSSLPARRRERTGPDPSAPPDARLISTRRIRAPSTPAPFARGTRRPALQEPSRHGRGTPGRSPPTGEYVSALPVPGRPPRAAIQLASCRVSADGPRRALRPKGRRRPPRRAPARDSRRSSARRTDARRRPRCRSWARRPRVPR